MWPGDVQPQNFSFNLGGSRAEVLKDGIHFTYSGANLDGNAARRGARQRDALNLAESRQLEPLGGVVNIEDAELRLRRRIVHNTSPIV